MAKKTSAGIDIVSYFLRKIYINSNQKCTYRSDYIDLTEIYVTSDDFEFRRGFFVKMCWKMLNFSIFFLHEILRFSYTNCSKFNTETYWTWIILHRSLVYSVIYLSHSCFCKAYFHSSWNLNGKLDFAIFVGFTMEF